MTAAYDDDTISPCRQEDVKNCDVPVDFASQKIVTTTLDESVNNSRFENGAADESSENASRNSEELPFPEACAGYKTVNSSITGRCVDVGNVVVNKGEGNCTSSEHGNLSETCLILRKQKNVEKTVSDMEENLSTINVQKSNASKIPDTKIEDKPCKDSFNFEKLSTELIDAVSFDPTSPSTSEGNVREEKDLSCNLTDENKSEKLAIFQELLIDSNALSVNCNNSQENGVKSIPLHEYASESSDECVTENGIQVSKSSDQIKTYQNVYRSKRNSFFPETRGSDLLEERCERGGVAEFLNKENFDDYDPGCAMSFHEAIRTGDAKSVELLIARGVVQNIDEPDWNVSGDPPLLVAATNHNLPVLRVLLANGCDPGVRSPRGETALHRAIINGSPSSVFEIVEELLKYGCPSTVKEAGGGLTALHILTRQLANAQSSKSLHHNFDIALKTLELLAKVGPVDAKDHQGRSALHLLASSSTFGNSHKIEIEPMIRTLLEAGADPAQKNDRGETPLHEALECGALNTAFLLIPHTPTGITSRYGETPLHIAARKNQSEVVDSLLKLGEDPSLQDAGGNTPLHLASARGFHQTVSLLVTSPLAQLEKTNDDGLTPLQVAAESGFVNAVKLLLKAGADPSQTANYCVTTLHRHPDISVLINHELTRRRQLAA
ncbi:ankyrin repeat, PH and SEC7 domain containing protein secG-like [Neodiprion fabricii]|uniref:ankyrin repeat, PH and SEC7 domain containing protein secG-like n=1 Tax=Neodiprion fabricii TaxID=2872261 RepID=UPI001ED9681F|nr:ankyrin repeat, PH and SEC7 domain containing protein secG-like [Neodiprion fabricii]